VTIAFYSDRFQEAVQLGAVGEHSSFIPIVFRKPSNWELRVIIAFHSDCCQEAFQLGAAE
jgi:hypothetical protein